MDFALTAALSWGLLRQRRRPNAAGLRKTFSFQKSKCTQMGTENGNQQLWTLTMPLRTFFFEKLKMA